MASISDDCLLHVLPDEMLQKILYSLSLRERAIASLVSPKWYRMISSFDHLRVRRYDSNHSLVKLTSDNTSYMEFYFLVPSPKYFKFSLSNSRFLTVLHLVRCGFDVINEFPVLKQIYFDSVYISDSNFMELISKCPSIVEITLKDPRNLSAISLPHLDNLRKVHVSVREIWEIKIKARNLLEFHLLLSSYTEKVKLDLCACTKLQVLKIDSKFVPIGFPCNITSAFPRLKSLSLRTCIGLNRFRIESSELEDLSLYDRNQDLDLDDAVIVTPNLRSFKLIDTDVLLPCLCPVVNPSRLMEAEIGLKYVDAFHRIPQLRTFAEKLGENVTFSMAIYQYHAKDVVYYGSRSSGSNSEPLPIKHINLGILFQSPQRFEYVRSVIDLLFTQFHPQTLLVTGYSKCLKDYIVQVLMNELKAREGECNCFGSKGWRNYLKDLQYLESTSKNGEHQIHLEFQWVSKSEPWYTCMCFLKPLKAAKAARRGSHGFRGI